jgi:hypothetical protein
MKFLYFVRDNFFNISLISIFTFVNILLLNLPLTKYASYEFFALNGLFIAFLSTFIFLRIIKNKTSLITIGDLIFSKLIIFLLTLPIIATVLTLIFSEICSISEALQFYIVFTVPAIFLGLVVSTFSFYVTKKYSYFVSSIILLGFAFLPIIDFYFLPQVYFFNPLITYFPGTIYDESIEVNQKIVLYRLLVSFVSVFIFIVINKFLLTAKGRRIKVKVLVISIMTSLFALTYFIYPHIGLSTTTERISNILNKKIDTENYTIHFDSSISSTEMEYINRLHQIYYSELTEYFSAGVNGKISSFVFSDAHQKYELIGAENADVAKPWLKQIYITADSYESTLKHELAHVFAGEFGANPFRVHPYLNFALIEGIAMAAEDDFAGYQLIDMVASSRNTDYAMNPLYFFEGTNFFVNASSIGYVNSGLFIQFIIAKFGIDKVKKWYSGERFNNIISKSKLELDSAFQEYIYSEQKQLISSITLQYYFGRSSIFMKECPRYIANKLKEAYKFYEKEKYFESLKIFEKLSSTTNNPQVLIGRVATLSELSLRDSALNLLNIELPYFKKSGTYYSLLLRKADLLYINGETDESISIYDSLLDYRITPYFTSVVMLRKRLHQNEQLLQFLTVNNESKLSFLIQQMKKDFKPELLLSIMNLSEKYQDDVFSILNTFISSLKAGVTYEQFFNDKTLSEHTIKIAAQYLAKKGEYEKGYFLIEKINNPTSNFSRFSSLFNRLKQN